MNHLLFSSDVCIEYFIYQYFDCCQPTTATIRVRGHITNSINAAHDLFSQVFGNQRWRISDLTYEPPGKDELASNGVLVVDAMTL